MGIAEDWSDLMFDLTCLQKGSAKKQFRDTIKYSFGGLCAYCRSERATTVDHLRPKSKGGSSLRSNLVPACRACNHSKGSEPWLVWFKQQSFYNETAQELIEEWITNKRFIEEELDDKPTYHRTTICSHTSTIRSHAHEQTGVGENGLTPA